MIGVQFQEILPQVFKEGIIRLHLLNEARKVSTEISDDFRRPTKYWSRQVHFQKRVSLAGGQVTILVQTDDDRYVKVSGGTNAPDIIEPTEKRALMFPGTFSSKTLPGTLDPRQGSRSGVIIVRRVLNPKSIEPRNFDLLVEEIWLEKFPDRMQEAFENAADRTGYALD